MSERDNNPTDTQRLYLLNATEMQQRISRSPRLGKLIKTSGKDTQALIRGVYVLILSRYPTPAEITTVQEYFAKSGQGKGPTANDLAWTLINGKEFLYRH